MARAARRNQQEVERNNFKNVEILRAIEFKNGGISFDMKADGVCYYNLSIVSGKESDFISEPSRKGSDDKYYKYYWLNLSQEMTDLIIDMVNNKLDNK